MYRKLAIFVMVAGLFGCGQKEMEQLKAENYSLKEKNNALEQQVAKLKETADYHYQQGMDLLSKKRYQEAKDEFTAVIGKYPTSPMVALARTQLGIAVKELKKEEAGRIAEEKRRQEEARYQEKTPDVADSEWLNFRNNEKQYEGTVTTWRVKCTSMSCGAVMFEGHHASCYLNNDYNRTVDVQLDGYDQCSALQEKDWLTLTGKFRFVIGGKVFMKSIRIKNLGAK